MLFGLFDNSVKETQIDFEKFYGESFLYVLDSVRARIDSREDSEDIAGDIFTELLEKKEKLSKVKYIKSYLKRIVKNKCAEYYKAKKTSDIVSLSEDTVAYEDLYDLSGESNTYADEKETAKQVISMLSETDKALYEEVHINKKSIKQLSEEKQINYDTLKRRYLRIREKVIKIIRNL